MKDEIGGEPPTLNVGRRQVLLGGGLALVALGVTSDPLSAFQTTAGGDPRGMAGVTSLAGAKKPVFVPMARSTDPVVHSLAESLFWLDQEMEHAQFFLMHMPSPQLDRQRGTVRTFEQQFAKQLARIRTGAVTRSSLAAFNKPTTELVRRFLDVKAAMQKAQASGDLKSLAWPTFFEHVALEGERFANRLDGFSKGNVHLDRDEVVRFWSRIMADHADFVAHLLDPKEKALIERAMSASGAWRAIDDDAGKDAVGASLDDLIAFKKSTQEAVDKGKVQSIIHPLLADHVVREALKFQDELRRT
jgi:hypothetical protein